MASSDICKLWATPLPLRGGGMLPSRILPGPMDGVTEGSFLAAMTARGYVRCWHAPFIRISTGIPRQARINDHLEPYMNQRLPVIAQMMGTNTDFLAGTAKRMLAAGAVCADLNCACPSPTVIGNHSGGARLRDPEWIAKTLGAIREAVGERPFSVKLRIGFDSPDEFPRIAAAVRPAAPDIVFLHYRTVREMYRPVHNGWERFLLARECLPDSVLIACGDIQSPQDAVRLAELCHVDGIAAARGLLSRPSLLRDIEAAILGQPPVPTDDKLRFLLDIATQSGRLPKANNGFILRLARSMFGEESDVFKQLATCKTVAASAKWLQEKLEIAF